MKTQPKARSPNNTRSSLVWRRIAFTLVSAGLLIAAYVASFAAIRKTQSSLSLIGWRAPDGHIVNTHVIHYFSETRALNVSLYYLYYPIHHWWLNSYATSNIDNGVTRRTDYSRPLYLDDAEPWPFG